MEITAYFTGINGPKSWGNNGSPDYLLLHSRVGLRKVLLKESPPLSFTGFGAIAELGGNIERVLQYTVSHLAQTDHTVNVTKAFRALYKIRGQQFRLTNCFVWAHQKLSWSVFTIFLRVHEKNVWLLFKSPGPPSVAVQSIDHEIIIASWPFAFGLYKKHHKTHPH